MFIVKENKININADNDITFIWCCLNGHTETARWLIQRSCIYGHIKIARWLIHLGESGGYEKMEPILVNQYIKN